MCSITVYYRDLIADFRSEANVRKLEHALALKHPKAHKTIKTMIRKFVMDFAKNLETQQLEVSRVADNDMKRLTAAFLAQYSSFLTDYVEEGARPRVDYFTLSAGSASRVSKQERAAMSADDMLKSWKRKASRPKMSRDDSGGMDTITGIDELSIVDCEPLVMSADYSQNRPGFSSDAIYSGRQPFDTRAGEEATINYYNDPREINDNIHGDVLLNKRVMALNNPKLYEDIGRLGDDRRLQSRKIFRSESGRENGLPYRQHTMHRRNFDAKMDEAFGGRELDNKVYKYC